MLSNYINDKYHGGGAMDCASVVFFMIGVFAGLLAMVVFLYISRKMTGCLSSFISHMRTDKLEVNDKRDMGMSEIPGVHRRRVYY